MIKPNWEIFKAKFSENPQDNFEWFCYLLFCREHEKPFGVFRHENQAAIETNPVEKDDEVIGWQAKFYDSTLRSNKNKILSTIGSAKENHPEITKLLLYCNKDWGQYRGGKPNGLIEIEEKASELEIDLDWRTKSFFESEFVSVDNELLSKHFFTLDQSIFNQIEDQKRHTRNVFQAVQTSISYGNQQFEIDRSNHLKDLEALGGTVAIIGGIGGVGKTVLIKNLFDQVKDKNPFYLFRATEFELSNVRDLFPKFSIYEFLEAHENEPLKTVVIDSAEKLLDLKNRDSFNEFLSILVREKWRVIFTTRANYLDDLNFQFLEIHKITPLNIIIERLEIDELREISEKQSFSLPKDLNLLELIRIPFYLSKYLQFYGSDEEVDYRRFKSYLWDNIIKCSKPEREQCFFKTASKRANDGHFFVTPNCDSQILNELVNDGILNYEASGYFITQDIYEEWALEKIVQSEFIKKSSETDFLKNIGQSLPIRRSFRNWLSELLLLESEPIKTFIESVVDNDQIESFWKDEVFTAVLLSTYSDSFFDLFKDNLLVTDDGLLERLSFVLRLACKTVDNDLFTQLGVKHLDLFQLKYVFTKPKGHGWHSFIKFVHENSSAIGMEHIAFVLPVIHDWNSKFKTGDTTRYASLAALRYYKKGLEEDFHFHRGNVDKKLIETIIYGASEIKTEIDEIFDQVIENKWKRHRDPHNELVKTILTKLEGFSVSAVSPDRVLNLANLYWSYTPPKNTPFGSSLDHGVSKFFGIEPDYGANYPNSAYRTPIYWLLDAAFRPTLQFVLDFTNRAVQSYANSSLSENEVEEVSVFVRDGKKVDQYISNRLWCMSRGTQVCPDVLTSMHMALEKFLLERGKNTDSGTLNSILLFLLRNSKSASISAIVASIVLAYPDKTFEVAKTLFGTKQFFHYDLSRLILDPSHKGQILTLQKSFPTIPGNELHEIERLKSCDDKHRQWSLENLFLQYQWTRSEKVSEKEAEIRQEELWALLDDYYEKLPKKRDQSEADKTWRLCLARMDRRKMEIKTEQLPDGVAFQFVPTIDEELTEFSQKAQKVSSEPMRFGQLRIWSHYKFENNKEYEEYEQYEDNPLLALEHTKAIISELKNINTRAHDEQPKLRDRDFYQFNHAIPAYVCAVLLRNHLDALNKKDLNFCKKIAYEFASMPLQPNYEYQVSDGTDAAIAALSILFEIDPDDRGIIKIILLQLLFLDQTIGISGDRFSIFPTFTVKAIWESNFSDAQSLFFGFLSLKPKYDLLFQKIREENFSKEIYKTDTSQVLQRFSEENHAALEDVIDNTTTADEVHINDESDLHTLNTALRLMPPSTADDSLKQTTKKIIVIFSEKIFSKDHEDKVDYKARLDFLKSYAYFILRLPEDEVQEYLEPVVDNFANTKAAPELFREFISVEDSLNSYEQFWIVWKLFRDPVTEVCKDGEVYWNVENIIQSYIFAQTPWKESANEWHTLKPENKRFFKDISGKLGHCPSTLYSISKLLTNVGSCYADDGVCWISAILKNNPNLAKGELEKDTVYYLENFVRSYLFKNQNTVKTTKATKDKLLILLNFLVNEGSVVGYMLRERLV